MASQWFLYVFFVEERSILEWMIVNNGELLISFSVDRNAVRAIIIAIVLSFLNQLSGCSTFLIYAGTILTKTENSINPYTASIAFGVVQIIGSLFTTQLADRLGRKVPLIVSLFGSALGQITLATFTYLQGLGYDLSMFNWVPLLSLSFIVFIATLGIVPLSSICTVEVLPAKVNFYFNVEYIKWILFVFLFQIRTIGMVINTFALTSASFLTTRYFPIMSEAIGMYGCLFFMASMCLLGILFVIFVMEETNGRNLDSIGTCRPETTASNTSNNNNV